MNARPGCSISSSTSKSFHTYYKKRNLGSRIGSGSTGQSEYQYGMGLVVIDTLPARARREAIEDVRSNRASASRSRRG